MRLCATLCVSGVAIDGTVPARSCHGSGGKRLCAISTVAQDAALCSAVGMILHRQLRSEGSAIVGAVPDETGPAIAAINTDSWMPGPRE